MRKTRKLAAVMAVALGVGITPYANAVIELKQNGTGDALIFPVFNGYVENYFTISNNHNAWVQGHLRFRGAAWTGELRDFDVILSPGDVFVFRIADLNGDGMWEIDQNLDPNNFAYTGQLQTCPDVAGNCMRPSTRLIPSPSAVITQAIIDHHQHVGYVEFFGEAVLDGMTHAIMNQLVNQTGARTDGVCSNVFNYQTKYFNRRGTNAWMWSDSDHAVYPNTAGPCDRGLSDVPNILSGTAFITLPGASTGVAYNAEVFTNFRTATFVDGDEIDVVHNETNRVCNGANTHYVPGEHRIDNYTRNSRFNFATPSTVINAHPNEGRCNFNQRAEDRAIILHDETAGTGAGVSPRGDYVYEFVANCAVPAPAENRFDEVRISFNNTWGPTLADGDDYNLGSNFTTLFDGSVRNAYNGLDALRQMKSDLGSIAVLNGEWDWLDDWDERLWTGNFLLTSPYNSIAEVEEAIRHDGQKFVSYYFDDEMFDKSAGGGNAALKSYYFAHFPTKFFYGESNVCYAQSTLSGYVERAATALISLAKPLAVEVWDIFENSGGRSTEGCISPDPCGVQGGLALQFELNFFDIGFLKGPFNLGGVTNYKTGRVVVSPAGSSNSPIPPNLAAFPGMFYTFEIDSDLNIGHWRSMQRGK